MKSSIFSLLLLSALTACSDKPKQGYIRSADGKSFLLGSRCVGADKIQHRDPNGGWLAAESCGASGSGKAPICVQLRSDAPAACRAEQELNFVTRWRGKKGQRIEFSVKDFWKGLPSHFTYRCGPESSEGEPRRRGRQGRNACTLKADGEVELTITGYVQDVIFNCSGKPKLSDEGWMLYKEGFFGLTLRAPEDTPSLISVEDWGQNPWDGMPFMFAGCDDLNQLPSAAPNLTQAVSLAKTFLGAERFNQDISAWDTSKVKFMVGMFKGATKFNQDIGGWDTRNVQDMSFMFAGAKSFNQSIGKWNTAKVTKMKKMFAGAACFDQDLSDWDTRKVETMESMFDGASSFNHPIGLWEVGQVENMSNMFRGAVRFNQDISRWDMKNVKESRGMFDGADAYNKAHKR